jgi:hypothetical protein
MEQKQLSLINKAYDNLYDLNSRFSLSFVKEQMEKIEEYMVSQGYKVTINSFDKCVFKKEKKEEH